MKGRRRSDNRYNPTVRERPYPDGTIYISPSGKNVYVTPSGTGYLLHEGGWRRIPADVVATITQKAAS